MRQQQPNEDQGADEFLLQEYENLALEYYYFVSKGLLGPPTKFTTLSPKNAAESIW
jgi:hypothetical protein